MNAVERLATLAEHHGWNHLPAYFTHDSTYSHGWVHLTASRMTSVLQDNGVQKGSRVFLASPDGIGWIVTFLAIARMGAIAVTVNHDLPASDHLKLAQSHECVLAISTRDLSSHFNSARWVGLEELLIAAMTAEPVPPARVAAETPMYVQFTSGTTGQPKGAVHKHSDLAKYHVAVGESMLDIQPDDVTLSSSKLCFPYGFGNSLVYPLHSGSAALLYPEWLQPERLAELASHHRVTILHSVPSMYADLVTRCSASSFTTVRAAVSAGEPLNPALYARATSLIGVPVLDELGSTEVGGAFCANTLSDNTPGTIGRPLPGYELALRDANEEMIEDGGDEVEGHLWVRGPTLFSEYMNLPEETARVMRDGWLFTNDTAKRRTDGRYVHTGRCDDIEIVGGLNISPVEVERILSRHPSVREIAVAVAVDDLGGRKLRAFVVPSAQAVPNSKTEVELIALARLHLEPHKVPHSVIYVESLPRTFTGKIRRSIVREGNWYR